MSSSRSFSRYTNRSSTQSDPSSSTDLKDVSYTLTKSKSTKNHHNLTAMVNKFMEKRSSKPKARDLVVAPDVTTFIADDLRKKAHAVRPGLGGLHKKLFGSRGKGEGGESDRKKALTEVKPNARSLAMVLRSERELLSQNKELETEIVRLKLMLEDKNTEVDKLKDLCLKQREEIKALKSAVLFPDVMLQEKQVVDSQEVLKQAKQIIPTLQMQVTSLTGQLHCLAQDLAEVKADKYSVMGGYDGLVSSPRTPTHEQEEATNSLEFSSGDQTTPGSPDDMFLNDLNPCLTPLANSKSRSKDFENNSSLSYNKNTRRSNETGFDSHGRKLSKGSIDQQYAKSFGRRSDENTKYRYGGW